MILRRGAARILFSLAGALGALLFAVSALAAPPPAPAAASCTFKLGFKDLADLIPDQIGQCTGDELHVANGDAQQATTGGLLVWRKADNWTAFTDGATTWINGLPFSRLFQEDWHAEMMSHVDHSPEPSLGRLDSERRLEAKRQQRRT